MSSSVTVAPVPGFVVKSSSLAPGTLALSSQHPTDPAKTIVKSVHVPHALKVFVNIAWADQVPPPPEGSDDAVRAAIEGQDLDEPGWIVPVVVSEGRQDTDKAGKPALVFDAVFHTSLKSRVLKDLAFKTFLIELALQRIEAQSSLSLSRALGTPNIASKGALSPRTAAVPADFFPPGHPHHASSAVGRKLVEEVAPKPVPKKGILRSKSAAEASAHMETPAWTWVMAGSAIAVTIHVPKLTREHLPVAALDLEPTRLLLSIPPLYSLDVDLDATDAELSRSVAATGAGPHAVEQALMLKRAGRELDVDGARAEWRVGEGRLVLYA
ncbi:hypothetical protein FA95DRAFT_1498222 [Auriscalpium vulgare]|uniref:Uncharacterized protein n=1 Tax=Auriscalpium vulgare TaxID=40419 RepID=A0ACB8RHM4_9AGAM|nr:hypothetical protein FA95DRAFT_1498222 [Auriscalpium vulgare]